jgi:lysophospholipase L1-like esterase
VTVRRWLFVALLAVAPASARKPAEPQRWSTAWASAQQNPDARNALPRPAGAAATTIRQIVRLTVTGRQLRIRLSNAFGRVPLVVTGVHVALSAGPGSSRIRPDTDQTVLFAGAPDVEVPAGADYWSDGVELGVAAGDSLAISIQLSIPDVWQTIHTASHATSFIQAGNLLSAPDMASGASMEHWAFLSGIDVASDLERRGIVALGDSITDGSWSTTDGNDRWPDILADRLRSRAHGANAVLNVGIGGNRLLLDGTGPNALSRLDRDVLGQAGARFLIVLEGINDIGMLTRDAPASVETHQALVRRLIAAYQQIITRARRQDLMVFGGTLLPFGRALNYHPDGLNEADRVAVNSWIRNSGAFDGVIDFDIMLRDPAHPDRLLPDYDSGDHLHPSSKGYRRMGEGIPLALFDTPAVTAEKRQRSGKAAVRRR